MHARACLLLLGWLLLTPPYGSTPFDGAFCTGCTDPGHLNEAAHLWRWKRNGSFPDEASCNHARDARIAAARDDQEWADWQLSRCFTEERAQGGRLRPGE